MGNFDGRYRWSVFFDGTMIAQSYLAMLQEQLLPLLQQQGGVKDLYFQQNGVPAHYAKLVRDWLDANLPNRWIGRRGPFEWPSRSPDLSSPDFFL